VTRERFILFDDALAERGVPPLTDWWREGIGSWLDVYEAGGALELLARVGRGAWRGAAKSTALYKLALFFALFGEFTVPLGERHFAIVLSRLKEEASKGVQIIHRWLDMLDVKHALAGDVIELADLPRGIRVVAASVAAASGWRAFFVGKDERSKWSSGDTADRDASEIDASAGAMTATHARAPVVAFGSAWARWGSFYEAIASGTDASKHVLGPTPTWIAAPHITEESTRRKERSEAMWRREYLCEASEEHDESIFRAVLLDRAARAEPGDVPPEPGVTYEAAMDPATRGNAWTFVIAALRWVGGKVVRLIVLHREARGTSDRPLRPEDVLRDIRDLCAVYGVSYVTSDQHQGDALAAIGRGLVPALDVVVQPTTLSSKLSMYESLGTWLADGLVELPPDAQLRADLLSVRRKLTVSGYTIQLPTTSADGRHADYAPCRRAGALESLVRAEASEARPDARRLPQRPHANAHSAQPGRRPADRLRPTERGGRVGQCRAIAPERSCPRLPRGSAGGLAFTTARAQQMPGGAARPGQKLFFVRRRGGRKTDGGGREVSHEDPGRRGPPHG
jgi:hypothetical protein